MKSVIILFILFCSLLCCNYIFSQQSNITYDNGSIIDIQISADVCADVITINGSYSGGGSICTGALPVTLSLFNTSTEKNNVKLYWKTANELNNSGFQVQRRSDGNEWIVLTFVQGNGTANEPVEYLYTDTKLLPGKYFYRLKQTDYNGNYEYFDLPLPVIISKPNEYKISQSYPNPSNPKCNIDYQVPEKIKVNITVYDLLGKLVMVLVNDYKEAGIYTVGFDGENVSSGTYFYVISAGNFKEIKKLVLVK